MTHYDFLYILNRLKIFHWTTTSYSSHKAFDKIHKVLDKHIDEFVEMFQGEYGTMPCGGEDKPEAYTNDSTGLTRFFNDCQDFLLITIPQHINSDTDKDLLNKRDEILGCFSTLKYLLTLN